jgi:hypothetical protein
LTKPSLFRSVVTPRPAAILTSLRFHPFLADPYLQYEER